MNRRALSPLILSVALALALGSGACATSHLSTPPGFAALDANDDYQYRATNADGVIVAVRVEPNRPEANLEFWSRAVDERLRSTGYEPDGDPRPVQSADGVPGVQYRYVRDREGRPHRYWVTVFVRGRVFIVEAGGDAEVFDRATPAVERAIASFHT